MKVIQKEQSTLYLSDSGDWAIEINEDNFEILPQTGRLIYQSGTNLDNLANLIVEAKAHAVANGIQWQQ
jgi:hypothetical protein